MGLEVILGACGCKGQESSFNESLAEEGHEMDDHDVLIAHLCHNSVS